MRIAPSMNHKWHLQCITYCTRPAIQKSYWPYKEQCTLIHTPLPLPPSDLLQNVMHCAGHCAVASLPAHPHRCNEHFVAAPLQPRPAAATSAGVKCFMNLSASTHCSKELCATALAKVRAILTSFRPKPPWLSMPKNFWT